ncbi:MAG TPA: hypothetical protein VKY45_13760 [Marinilabiliaceae bacterium]|nr:hypothetical protein [Marinilabiliaceae bacterium]
MKITEFWRKNRLLIVSILGILIILNYCARMWQPEEVSYTPLQNEEQFSSDRSIGDKKINSYEDPINKQPQSKPSQLDAIWQIIVTLALTGVLLYYGFTRGWYARFIPKWVAFSTPIYRDKLSKRLVMRITVANNTNESKTFLSPQIYFKRFQETRKFKIKTTVFPLTLMPSTKQDIVIDIDQFWDKISDLSGFNRVGAIIEESNGKVHRTWARPKWFL